MCKSCEIAKYTINMCIDLGLKIDTPKVQKLLVLMHGKHLAQYGEPLFPENVEAWECGVAIREVHKAFKSYVFGIEDRQECFLMLLNSEENIVHEVIKKFGKLDVFEINQDNRLRIIKETYFDGNSAIVPNNFIRKVFIDKNEYSD